MLDQCSHELSLYSATLYFGIERHSWEFDSYFFMHFQFIVQWRAKKVAAKVKYIDFAQKETYFCDLDRRILPTVNIFRIENDCVQI